MKTRRQKSLFELAQGFRRNGELRRSVLRAERLRRRLGMTMRNGFHRALLAQWLLAEISDAQLEAELAEFDEVTKTIELED